MNTQEQKRRETIIHHITLNTGHAVSQTWSDINPEVVDILRNDLSPLFLSDGQRRIQECPGFPCYLVERWSPNPTIYLFTVYSNPERVPLIRIAVGLYKNKRAFDAWRDLCAVARSIGVPSWTLGALQALPLPPWCGVLFLPGLGDDPDMVEWLSGRRDIGGLDATEWLMPRLRYPDERPSSRLRNGVGYEPDPENDPDTVDCLSQFERCIAWAVWERLERVKERMMKKVMEKTRINMMAGLALIVVSVMSAGCMELIDDNGNPTKEVQHEDNTGWFNPGDECLAGVRV